MECFNKKDYEHAEDYLGYAGNYKDAAAKLREVYYYLGADELKRNLFDQATEHLQAAGNFKNAKTLLVQVSYEEGLEKLQNKAFADAKAYFLKCGKYKYAQDLARVCTAEIYYKDDRISAAAKQYKLVSPKVKVSEFDVQGRKAEVTKEASFAVYEGDWTPRSNSIYVKNTKKTRRYRKWKKWYFKSLVTDQSLEITCGKNDDGTYYATIEVSFMRFSNFSYNRDDLETNYHYIKRELDNLKTFPTSIKLENGVTLKYKKGVFTLSYAKNVKKGSTKTEFRSTVKFKKS